MNIIMNIFTKWFKRASKFSPMIGKTVIRFITHGCQGQIHEFDYVGIITNVSVEFSYPYTRTYTIMVLKGRNGEKRDGLDETKYCTNWQIQNIGEGILVAYD